MTKKTAIVTGGVRGIGFAIAQKLVEDGLNVVICSRHKEEVDEAASKLSNVSCLGLVVDVAKDDDCQRLVDETIKKFGSIDLLVNNAGIYGPIGLLEDNSIEKWIEALNINLVGAVRMCRLVIPIMKKQGGGKIVNLAGGGVGGTKQLPRFTAYYTSKIAIAGFTETLAAEVASNNIQVNCISPGAIKSYFTDYLIKQGKEKAGEEMYSQAMKQLETGGDDPQLAAKLVSFLNSDRANHVTGKIISAKWDNLDDLADREKLKKDLLTLRRIDGRLFVEGNKI